jgi:hypothetical protein
MEATNSTSKIKTISRSFAIWLWPSIVAALLAWPGSLIALVNNQIYDGFTPSFMSQALAQDIANLSIVSPELLVLATLALRGSLHAYLVWLGVVLFTVYSYLIDTSSIPFGPLFLLWVTVLGLCIYSLIGGVATVNHRVVESYYSSQRVTTIVGWVLIITVVLIGLLWLSTNMPALLVDKTLQSLINVALPINPALDLVFFLPAIIAIGGLLLKKKPLAYTLAPSFIVFLILRGMHILLIPIVQAKRGEMSVWSADVPIGTLTLILIGLLIWLMSTIQPHDLSI